MNIKPISMMKKIILLISVALFLVFACKKEEVSERFRCLTGHIWTHWAQKQQREMNILTFFSPGNHSIALVGHIL